MTHKSPFRRGYGINDMYRAPYDENHTLLVDGDTFSESVRERALYLASQKYPDMSDKEVRQFLASATPECDTILDQAHVENLDAYLWAECVSLDNQQDLIWIEEN